MTIIAKQQAAELNFSPAACLTYAFVLRGVRQLILRKANYQSLISTHAPAWGATAAVRKQIGDALISTHAPAWGATLHLDKNIGRTAI